MGIARKTVTERCLLMQASRLFAGCLVVFTSGGCFFGQDTGPPAGQPLSQSPSSPQSSSESSSSQSSSSKPQSHRSAHHVQVPDDDSPAQSEELTAAEAAIEKKDYGTAEPLLRKLVDREPASYVAWFD